MVKTSTEVESDHFAKRGLNDWQVRIGDRRVPALPIPIALACRAVLPGRCRARSGPPQPQFQAGRPMRDAAKNVDATGATHYSNKR